jgi:hypothetical protein
MNLPKTYQHALLEYALGHGERVHSVRRTLPGGAHTMYNLFRSRTRLARKESMP